MLSCWLASSSSISPSPSWYLPFEKAKAVSASLFFELGFEACIVAILLEDYRDLQIEKKVLIILSPLLRSCWLVLGAGAGAGAVSRRVAVRVKWSR